MATVFKNKWNRKKSAKTTFSKNVFKKKKLKPGQFYKRTAVAISQERAKRRALWHIFLYDILLILMAEI